MFGALFSLWSEGVSTWEVNSTWLFPCHDTHLLKKSRERGVMLMVSRRVRSGGYAELWRCAGSTTTPWWVVGAILDSPIFAGYCRFQCIRFWCTCGDLRAMVAYIVKVCYGWISRWDSSRLGEDMAQAESCTNTWHCYDGLCWTNFRTRSELRYHHTFVFLLRGVVVVVVWLSCAVRSSYLWSLP